MIAGDDPQAKAPVTAFLESIGYGAVDVGPLAEGWRYDAGSPAYGAPSTARSRTKLAPRPTPPSCAPRWPEPAGRPGRARQSWLVW
jgi:hypothetical protein